MATINKTTIRPKRVKWKKPLDLEADRSENYYGSAAWQRLRNTYLSLHPLCESCLQHGKIEPATSVHHRSPFMQMHTAEARWTEFLRESNLMAVCSCCHNGFHRKLRIHNLREADTLTDDEWTQAQLMYEDGQTGDN